MDFSSCALTVAAYAGLKGELMKALFRPSIIGRLAVCAIAGLIAPVLMPAPASAQDAQHSTRAAASSSWGAGAIGLDLVRADGTPARGAKAVLYAWPDERSLARMKLGDQVKLIPVATATSDVRGHLDLRITRSDVLTTRADAHGFANVELIATDATSTYSRSFPVSLATRSNSPVTALLDGSTKVAALGPLITPRTRGSVSGRTSRFVKDLGMRNVTVAYAYAVPGAATVQFIYKEGATSALGVAGSVSGKYGTFKASGTTSRAANAEQGFPKVSGYKELITKFRYGKWKVQCSGYPHGEFVKYTVAPKNFEGGGILKEVKAPPATRKANCVPQKKGSWYRKSDTTAYENAVGASLSPVIGIDLSARTGYTKSASLHFVWKRTGQLCGTNAPPGKNPKRLVAK
jgi:hypothetical protein